MSGTGSDVSRGDPMDVREGSTGPRDERKAPIGDRLSCPECGSERLFRDGWRELSDGSKVQRYLCRDCGYRFTDPHSKHRKAHETESLNRSNSYLKDGDEDLGSAGSRSEMGKVLEVESVPLKEKPAGGVVTRFAAWLKSQGKTEETVKNYSCFLKKVVENSNVYDPEEVKRFIAGLKVSNASKMAYVKAYDTFLKFVKGSWEMPKFKVEEKIPFIPTEEELDQLIAGCGRKTSTLLQLLKETGARLGEALKLKWTDVDFERRLVKITPEKGSKPRILPISLKLIEMLNSLPRENEKIFPAKKGSWKKSFINQRNRLAVKLNNPRLKNITFHVFRHWKGTIEYHKTKDILHVKEVLGHKNIQNTMIYVTIEKALYQQQSDEFHVKVAQTKEEIVKLLEAGFEYVFTHDGLAYFRKRK